MKKFSSKGTSRNADLPETSSASVSSEEIPSGLEYFFEPAQKISRESLASVSTKFAELLANEDKEFIDWASGLFAATGMNLGVQVPEWTKVSSGFFWEGLGLKTSLQGTPSDIGYLIGLIGLAPETDTPSKPEKAIRNFVDIAKLETLKLPPEELLEFAQAQVKSPQIFERFATPNQRTKIYGIIAAGWRKVQSFNSTEQLYDWLMSLKDNDVAAELTLARATESREIRKVCKRIGLTFENKWTRQTQEL